ncbi:MAG: hypothetical protein K2X86_11505 [Cytophagaceae bacterium]|nr:hypothetical protein [Cytophagaceae bacterium]
MKPIQSIKRAFVAFLIFSLSYSHAQEFYKTDFISIDSYALKTPAGKTKIMDTLAHYLTIPAKNEVEKARSIFRWVAENISYDFDAYLSGNIPSQHASDILKCRKGVCAGYAALYKALCDRAGIECEIVEGYAKGYSYEPGAVGEGTNHAWNAVKINGKWYLLDATWSSGRKTNHNKTTNEEDFEEFYFCPDPADFIYSHFPEEEKWQLLDKPVTRKEFFNLITPYPQFFYSDISNLSYNQPVIYRKIFLNLKAREGTSMMYWYTTPDYKELETATWIDKWMPQTKEIEIEYFKNKEYLFTLYTKDEFGDDITLRQHGNTAKIKNPLKYESPATNEYHAALVYHIIPSNFGHDTNAVSPAEKITREYESLIQDADYKLKMNFADPEIENILLKAIDLKPESSYAYFRMAKYFSGRNNNLKEEEYLIKAFDKKLAENPNNILLRYNIGAFYYNQGVYFYNQKKKKDAKIYFEKSADYLRPIVVFKTKGNYAQGLLTKMISLKMIKE